MVVLLACVVLAMGVLSMYRICKVENRSLKLKKHVEKYESALQKMYQKQTELEAHLNELNPKLNQKSPNTGMSNLFN